MLARPPRAGGAAARCIDSAPAVLEPGRTLGGRGGAYAWWSARARTRSPRYDLGAIGLVIIVIAIATAGVYLMALAAAAFVAWLVRVATQHRPDLVVEQPPRLIAAPYTPVLHVDPAVFVDDAGAKATAKRAFESWVSRLPRAPGRSLDLVRSVDIRTRFVARLTTEIEGRRVVECCEPTSSREPPRAPPCTRQAIDPWNPPDDLARASRFIVMCWTCSATGRLTCSSCHGTARQACASCEGTGKYYGQTANGAHRVLNCKTCRGKGSVTCKGCTRGKIDCATCQQAKKLACWFEIRSDLRQDVQLVPDGATMQPFSWGQRGATATTDQLGRDARIVDTVAKLRPLTPADLPATVPAGWRIEHGPRLQARIDPGERVRSQTLTFLSVPSAAVAYSVLGEQHTVVLEGLRMLAPPTTAAAAEPFLRRGRMLARLKLALAALPAAAIAIYAARGDYFVTGGAVGLVTGVVAAAVATGTLAYAALWNATLGRRRARIWAVAAIVPVALATLLAAIAEPRIERARDLIAAGQLDPAAVELRALDLPIDHVLWGELRLHRSLAATTCSDATAHLHDIRPELPQRVQAQTHADDLALAEAEAALHARNPGVASSALACGSEATRATPRARALRARIADLETGRCLEIKDWTCALERALSGSDPGALRSDVLAAIRTEAEARGTAATRDLRLEQRIAHEQAALTLWHTYLLDPQRPDLLPRPVTDLRAALSRDQAALATQQRIAQARADAEARRQTAIVERERKQAEVAAERERRREAAEEARANRSSNRLLCNDGTLSPTCTCSGSHRGCCSWHGGVAGCQ